MFRLMVCSLGENKYQVMAKHNLSLQFAVVVTSPPYGANNNNNSKNS